MAAKQDEVCVHVFKRTPIVQKINDRTTLLWDQCIRCGEQKFVVG